MSELSIKPDDRQRHIYLSGKTRSGKSTLMHAMIYQDMRNGVGLALIDGKGSDKNPLAEKVLDWVPARRKSEVIYLDIDKPVPIDFMSYRHESEASKIAGDISQMLNRLNENIGDRMDVILHYIVVALNLTGKPTFMDIHKMLTDEQFRKDVKKNEGLKRNPEVYRYWYSPLSEQQINKESGVALAITQFGKFAISPTLSTILGTPGAELKIEDVVDEGKILIVRLNADDPESMVFGSLLVSKIQQAIFRRKPDDDHPPFALYVDEFQDFRPAAFGKILSQGGGLGLYLTLANQYFEQLHGDVRSAIVNSVHTFFLFNMRAKNAADLADLLVNDHLPPPQTYLPDVSQVWGELVTAAHRSRLSRKDEDYEAYFERHGPTAEEEIDELLHRCDPFYETSTMRPVRRKLAIAMSMKIATEIQIRDRMRCNASYASLKEALNFIETTLKFSEKMLRPEIDALKARERKPETWLDQLPRLKPGQAIYRSADGTVRRIRTPMAPDLDTVGKTSHAAWIKENTLAQYGTNRTNLSPACSSAQVQHTSGNGKPEYESTAELPDNKSKARRD